MTFRKKPGDESAPDVAAGPGEKNAHLLKLAADPRGQRTLIHSLLDGTMDQKIIMRRTPLHNVVCIDRWRCPVEKTWQRNGYAVIG